MPFLVFASLIGNRWTYQPRLIPVAEAAWWWFQIARTQIHARTFKCITLAGGCYTIGYPKETHLKPKSGEISFIETLLSIARPLSHVAQSSVVLLPCTAMLSVKFQNRAKLYGGESAFTRFEFKMIRLISYIVTTPALCSMPQSPRYAAYI